MEERRLGKDESAMRRYDGRPPRGQAGNEWAKTEAEAVGSEAKRNLSTWRRGGRWRRRTAVGGTAGGGGGGGEGELKVGVEERWQRPRAFASETADGATSEGTQSKTAPDRRKWNNGTAPRCQATDMLSDRPAGNISTTVDYSCISWKCPHKSGGPICGIAPDTAPTRVRSATAISNQ